MENEVDIKSIFGLIRRQVWIIFSVVIAVLVLTTAVTFSLTPRYTATAKILVDTSSKNLLNPDERILSSNTDNARVESEVEILSTDNVKIHVIHDKNLISDDEFGISIGLTDQLLNRLNLASPRHITGQEALGMVLQKFGRSISVRREGLTYIISASVTSASPAKAAMLANSLVDAYIVQQVQSKISSVVAGRESLQTQATQANAALAASEKKFDEFLVANLDRIEKEAGSTDISRLRSELERIQRERDEQSGRVRLAELSIRMGDYSAIVNSLQDAAVSELERQREALTSKIAATAENSASSLDLRAELQKVQDSLKQHTALVVGDLRKQIAAAERNAGDVRQQLRASILASDLPPEVLTNIYSLQQTSEIARGQYQNILARIQELDAQASLQVADSRVVSAALVPAEPSFPNKRLIFALALTMALTFGLGLAILREHFIGGFVSDEQVEAALRISLASVMPRQPSSSGDVTHSIADLIIESPLSMFSEGVRRIRVKIEQMLYKKNGGQLAERRDGIAILVSSTEPNEGKSTVSLALARTLASAGKRCVLIDCDLRKPSIHELLGMRPSTELIDLLRGHDIPSIFPNITTKDPMSNLKVVLGGRLSEHATDELLMGDRIARLLMIAKKNFDYVVIDTPPVDPVVDSLYLARHADVIAFVVRWASTSQSLARKSVAALMENAQPNTPVIAILNQKEQTRVAGYYKYSGYYTK
jgi:capsular exopolysaccharide synthesis family protein